MTPASPPAKHQFDFVIDEESYETAEHQLTPSQLLSEFAHLDPAAYYLVELRGQQQVSYQNQADAPIHMHEHAKFITVSLGPTPVS
jgi:hypothetical protein